MVPVRLDSKIDVLETGMQQSLFHLRNRLQAHQRAETAVDSNHVSAGLSKPHRALLWRNAVQIALWSNTQGCHDRLATLLQDLHRPDCFFHTVNVLQGACAQRERHTETMRIELLTEGNTLVEVVYQTMPDASTLQLQ